MLPLSVLERAGAEITNYHGSGMSVMEMSHRSKVFIQIFEETQAKLRRLMKVPDNYKILFLQTGATGQFSMIPLNLIGKTGRADYAVTGNFSNLAYKEAQKYGQISLAASSEDRNHTYPQPGPAEAGPGGQLLLLLRQQHRLRYRVAVCPRNRQRPPGVRHVL